jgi:hypothetical protein
MPESPSPMTPGLDPMPRCAALAAGGCGTGASRELTILAVREGYADGDEGEDPQAAAETAHSKVPIRPKSRALMYLVDYFPGPVCPRRGTPGAGHGPGRAGGGG